MKNTDIKRYLLEHVRSTIQRQLDQLVQQEKNVLSMGNQEKMTGENLIESDSEEVMTSRQYLMEITDQLQATLQRLATVSEDKVIDSITLGAVVVTDTRRFFVSAASTPIDLGDNTYYPISPASPLFIKMTNESNGGAFEFNNVQYKILDVY
jgi:hypothetical protein